MNKMKRFLASVLALMLVISMVPVTAFAAEECNHENAYIPTNSWAWRCDECNRWFGEDPRPAEEPEEPSEPEEPECEHDFTWKLVSNDTIAKEGDCEHATEYYYSCRNCEALDLEHTFTVSQPAGHQWDEGVVTKEATCEEEGEITYTCTVCEATKTEAIEVTGHDYSWKLVATTTVAKKADCENAAEYYYSCRDCEALDLEHTFTIGDPLGHDWDEGVVTKEATCEEDGEITYTCANGCTKTEPVEATGHDYSWKLVATTTVAKKADCEHAAEYYYSCRNCEALDLEHTFTIGEPLGHDWDEGVVTKEATCEEDGEITYTCANGCTKTEPIEATGHDYSWKLVATTTVAKKADCENAAEYYYSCRNCEALDLEHTFTIGEPLGHEWDEGVVTKEATCEEDGEITYTCTVCEATKTEAIEATGHGDCDCETEEPECEHDFTWKLVATTTLAKEADCEHAAEYYYSCRKCEALDLEHTFTVSLPAGHQWDEGEVTKEATCEEEGEVTYTCTVCESTKTEPIEATGHDFTWKLVATTTVAKEADCENAAEYYYSCHNCEALDKEHTFTIGEPLGHDYVETVIEPTCCAGGYTMHKCSRCGDTYYDNDTEATGEHTYEDGCTAEKPVESVPATPVKPAIPNWVKWFNWLFRR